MARLVTLCDICSGNTLLAGPTFLHINTLAHPAGQLGQGETIGTLRSNDMTETRTSRKKYIYFFQSLWRLFLHTYYVKCRQTLLNLNSKGPYPSSEREIKFLRCLFTFSIKRKIWHFHVVVVQKRQRNHGTKKCTSRAKLLFCLLKQLFFLTSSLLFASLNLKVPNQSMREDYWLPAVTKVNSPGRVALLLRATFLHINGAIVSLQVLHNTI